MRYVSDIPGRLQNAALMVGQRRLQIRAAEPHEADMLTALALRSKAQWGYSAEFMERCVPLLRVTAEYMQQNSVRVAVEDGAIVGFYSLLSTAAALELDLMFVEPGHTRAGIGAALLTHALQTAASTGHAYLIVESDPNAEAFYLRSGAERTGGRASTIKDGRLLPLLTFDLARWSAGGAAAHAARAAEPASRKAP